MASANTATFNGPFKRAELLLLPQYAASDDFLAAGKWTGTKGHVLSLDSGESAQTTEPLYCIVVGMITADKTYLGKHGNFSPKYNEDARKAKIQFMLARPNDPDFGSDFEKAILAFKKCQAAVSVSAIQQFFIFNDDGSTMRMNYGLFEPKGVSRDNERERETLAYNVDREHETYWSSAKASNYSCIMPVFDTNDMPINPDHFAEKLVGAMCEVTFTLRHFAINSHTKPDGKWIEANDVFSAQVETVAILKNPPVLTRSPYKGRLTRRPRHKPQLPTREEQVNAAQAFVPRPDTLTDHRTSPFPDTCTVVVPSTVAATSTADLNNIEDTPTVGTVANPKLPGTKETDAGVIVADPLAIPTLSVAIRPAAANTIVGKIRARGSSTSLATLTSDDGKNVEQTVKKRKIGD